MPLNSDFFIKLGTMFGYDSFFIDSHRQKRDAVFKSLFLDGDGRK